MDKSDFLCINCQELINEDKIHKHSIICVHPSAQSINIEAQPIISQLIYRIKKLNSALSSHITEKLPQVDKELYEFLIIQANELLTIEKLSQDSIEKCKSTLYILERYSKSYLNPSVLLYNERLKVIAIEAVNILNESLSGQINSLDAKYRELEQAKQNVFKGIISNQHNIDEISSQISQI